MFQHEESEYEQFICEFAEEKKWVIIIIINVTSSSTIAERPRDARVILRFAKLRSGIFEPPFWGLRENVDASCVRRWKKRGRLLIGDN